MEIEPRDEQQIKNNNSSYSNQEKDKISYLSQLLGIKVKPDELQFLQDFNDFNLLINSIKFSDKKKNEFRDSISNEIKNIQNDESLQKMEEEKSKKFCEIVKLNGKTTIYHTAENDELSQTMHAFYFCDKTKQVFSDKQEAEYKAMHLDAAYELPIPRGFAIKEEDNLSNYSNLKSFNNQNDNFYNNDTKLIKKKRKMSNNKSKSNKKRFKEKISISEEHNNYNNNSKNGEWIASQEREYCIAKCKYGRKSKNQPMIECDKCRQWYHTKCLSFTNEQFQKYNGKGKIWYCPRCSKMDVDDKKNLID